MKFVHLGTFQQKSYHLYQQDAECMHGDKYRKTSTRLQSKFAPLREEAAKWLECYAYNNYGCE
jgi:hypothetical protein